VQHYMTCDFLLDGLGRNPLHHKKSRKTVTFLIKEKEVRQMIVALGKERRLARVIRL
jgi:hypothetical protein